MIHLGSSLAAAAAGIDCPSKLNRCGGASRSGWPLRLFPGTLSSHKTAPVTAYRLAVIRGGSVSGFVPGRRRRRTSSAATESESTKVIVPVRSPKATRSFESALASGISTTRP